MSSESRTTSARRSFLPWRMLYPEIERFDSVAEGERLLESLKVFRTVHLVLFILSIVILCPLCTFWAGMLLERRLGIPSGFTSLAGAIVLALAAIGVMEWLRHGRCRRYLREQLQERGIPICIACGYDLVGQQHPRCSECGTAFDPKLLKMSGRT